MRDGRTYQFAGVIESVRTTNGETIRVDNEGTVQDDSQTGKTVQRGAIGAATRRHHRRHQWWQEQAPPSVRR